MGFLKQMKQKLGFKDRNGTGEVDLKKPVSGDPPQGNGTATRRVRSRKATVRYEVPLADGTKKIVEKDKDDISGIWQVAKEGDEAVDAAFQTLNDCYIGMADEVQEFADELEEKTSGGEGSIEILT